MCEISFVASAKIVLVCARHAAGIACCALGHQLAAHGCCSPRDVERTIRLPQVIDPRAVAAGCPRGVRDRPAVGDQLEEPLALRRRDRAATTPRWRCHSLTIAADGRRAWRPAAP